MAFSLFIHHTLDHILGPVGVYEGIRSVHDDNYIDRLSHYYTVIFLLFMQITVATNEYVGDPIHCFCPTEFTENEVDYTNFVCWVSNTYHIPFSKQIPANYEVRKNDEITYYQWVPLILLLMAFLFKMPRNIWKYFAYTHSGIGLKKMIDLVKTTQNDTPEEREKKLNSVAKFIDLWMSKTAHHRAGCFPSHRSKVATYFGIGVGRHYGNYLVFLCLFTKCLFLLNAVGQLFFLNEFLGSDKFYIYGYEVVHSILTENDWTRTHRFPRVTLCDFDLRQMTNVQRWTLQCVLPVNLYNEKFFIFLWFWITIVAILTLFNVLYSILLIAVPNNRKSFVKKYLKFIDAYDDKNKDLFTQKLTKQFVENYLRLDGIFLLKVITANTNTVMITDIIRRLFDIYRKRQFHMETNGVSHTVHAYGEPESRHHVTPLKGRVVHLSEDDMPKSYMESFV
ncbi:innexin unc-9-like isoform X1 [Saccostrea echinata]|uniref:innexin unc-9-like isoform X1 n=1 Tax=Saccostrea echinata TaxID=191078 RepID=UPI002A7F6A2C|nr:innexin unc-9-like isoform X1 [Saccostrea echinata]